MNSRDASLPQRMLYRQNEVRRVNTDEHIRWVVQVAPQDPLLQTLQIGVVAQYLNQSHHRQIVDVGHCATPCCAQCRTSDAFYFKLWNGLSERRDEFAAECITGQFSRNDCNTHAGKNG